MNKTRKLIDETGNIYGRLTVVARKEKRTTQGYFWECACSCGKTTEVRGVSLRKGVTKSCGCLTKESAAARFRTHGCSGSGIPGKRTRLYRIWANMKQRCYNPKVVCFEHYGGKGIAVCEAWHGFIGFSKWALSSGYADILEIDREDGAKDYCPENCRWATRQQQVLNSLPRLTRTKSPYKGVYKLKHGTRWRAYVRVMGRTISLGCHASAEEAARAYDRAAVLHYGEFARPNFKQA